MAMFENIETLAIMNPRMTVLDLLMKVRHGKTRSELRKYILRTGIELNGELLNKPEDSLLLKTNDILRVGKGEWYRIKIVELHELETERLTLKPLQIEDLDFIQKYLPEWEAVKYLSGVKEKDQDQPKKSVMTPKAAAAVASEVFKRVILQPEPKTEFLWKIEQKSSPGKIIGLAHLHTPEGEDAREKIWLDPALRDENLMMEVMSAVNEHAFSNMGMSNIVFQHAFAHAAAPREIDMLRHRFMAMDASARNMEDPVGTWGLTRDGWEKMKDWLRPNQSKRARGTLRRKQAEEKEKHHRRLQDELRRVQKEGHEKATARDKAKAAKLEERQKQAAIAKKDREDRALAAPRPDKS